MDSLIEISEENDDLLSSPIVQRMDASSFDCSPLLRAPQNLSSSTCDGDERCYLNSEEGLGKENACANRSDLTKLSLEPQAMKRKKKGGYNLRKSLAWNKAFFTEEGILDPMELSMLCGDGLSSTEMASVPEEDEMICGSLNSACDTPCSNQHKDKVCELGVSSAVARQKASGFLSPNLRSAARNKSGPASTEKRKLPSTPDVDRSVSHGGAKKKSLSSLQKPSAKIQNKISAKGSILSSCIPRQEVSSLATSKRNALSSSQLKTNESAKPMGSQKVGAKPFESSTKSGGDIKVGHSNPMTKPVLQAKRNVVSRENSSRPSINMRRQSQKIDKRPGTPNQLLGPTNVHVTSSNGKAPTVSFNESIIAEEKQVAAKPSGLRLPSPSLGFFREQSKATTQSITNIRPHHPSVAPSEPISNLVRPPLPRKGISQSSNGRVIALTKNIPTKDGQLDSDFKVNSTTQAESEVTPLALCGPRNVGDDNFIIDEPKCVERLTIDSIDNEGLVGSAVQYNQTQQEYVVTELSSQEPSEESRIMTLSSAENCNNHDVEVRKSGTVPTDSRKSEVGTDIHDKHLVAEDVYICDDILPVLDHSIKFSSKDDESEPPNFSADESAIRCDPAVCLSLEKVLSSDVSLEPDTKQTEGLLQYVSSSGSGLRNEYLVGDSLTRDCEHDDMLQIAQTSVARCEICTASETSNCVREDSICSEHGYNTSNAIINNQVDSTKNDYISKFDTTSYVVVSGDDDLGMNTLEPFHQPTNQSSFVISPKEQHFSGSGTTPLDLCATDLCSAANAQPINVTLNEGIENRGGTIIVGKNESCESNLLLTLDVHECSNIIGKDYLAEAGKLKMRAEHVDPSAELFEDDHVKHISWTEGMLRISEKRSDDELVQKLEPYVECQNEMQESLSHVENPMARISTMETYNRHVEDNFLPSSVDSCDSLYISIIRSSTEEGINVETCRHLESHSMDVESAVDAKLEQSVGLCSKISEHEPGQECSNGFQCSSFVVDAAFTTNEQHAPVQESYEVSKNESFGEPHLDTLSSTTGKLVPAQENYETPDILRSSRGNIGSVAMSMGIGEDNEHVSLEVRDLSTNTILPKPCDSDDLQNIRAHSTGMCSTDTVHQITCVDNTLKDEEAVAIKPTADAVPFSEEWLAAIEAAGEEILTRKSGAVQNSPPEKSLPEPSPWSPVNRSQGLGPFDCTKFTNINMPPSAGA